MVDIIGRVCRLIAVVNTPEVAGILGAFPISKHEHLNVCTSEQKLMSDQF